MINNTMWTTTVTSRQSKSLAEAKEKGPVYDLIDRLETAEKKLLETIKAHDDGEYDSSKTQKDLVVVRERKLREYDDNLDPLSFSGLIHSDGYDIEMATDVNEKRSNGERLTIKKDGNLTHYTLRRGWNDGENAFRMPQDTRRVDMTKDTSGEEPSYTIVQGRIGLAMHGLGAGIASLAKKIHLPKIKIERS